MDTLNYNQQVFILNGQPVIIQRNTDVNTANNINNDILQHALHDANTPTTDTVNSQIDAADQFMQSVQEAGDDNCASEYVAYVGSNEDDSPTIHLTVEQAAELGIQFDVDEVKLRNEVGTGEEENAKNESSEQYIFTKTTNENCLYSTANGLTNSDFQQNHSSSEQSKSVSSQNDFDSTIEPINQSLNDAANQQLTLIPHFLNGTVAYTLQVNSTSNVINQLKTNNISNTVIKDPSLTSMTGTVSNNDFNISNLTTSSAVLSSLLQSNLTTTQVISTSGIQAPTTNLMTSRSSVNVPNKVTYILPDTLLNTHSNNITNKMVTNSLSNYENASLPQIIDSVRKQRSGILSSTPNNGFIKPKPILKGSNSLIVNRDVTDTILVPNSNTVTLPATVAVSGINQVTAPVTKPKTNMTLVCDNMEVQTSIHSKENNPGFRIDSARTINNKLIVPDKSSSTFRPICPGDTNLLPKEITKVLNRLQPANNAKKPLGSSDNPIQLVQHGQTFTSYQSLTEDQMKQVTTVLQQKNFNLNVDPPTKNVLYDAETNTRIIYRVVYPEELDLKEATGAGDETNRGRKRGRPPKNRPTDSLGDQPALEAPRRKQPLPRTRSGRLSRPPRHMVRDYKRIRRMDLDDPDGAYSDYQSDDHEEETNNKNLLPGLTVPQKRNISSTFRCPSCSKIYLGYRRMARHFDKNPGHGSQEYLLSLKKASEANKQLYTVPMEVTDDTGAQSDVNAGGGVVLGKGKAAGKKKGRTCKRAGSIPPDQMRARLKELLELCDESELVEVAGPAVASVLSAWELLLLRVEATSVQTRVTSLCDEIKGLLDRVREIGCSLFQPLDELVETPENITYEMKDEEVSSVFGVPCGVYRVEESLLQTEKVLTKHSKIKVEPVRLDSNPVINKLITNELQVLPGLDKPVVDDPIKERETTVQFLLPSDAELLCDERGLDSVDQIVKERLQNFTTTQNQDLCKSAVDELIFNALERSGSVVRNRSDLEPPDDLMAGFSIANRRPHVSASTEDLIKSLENFSSELPSEDRQGFTTSDNFNRVNVPNVDTIDFEVLSREFHSGNVNQQ